VAPAGPDQATVNNRAKRVTVAVAAAALVAIAAFVLLSRDDGEKGAVVASSSSNSTSSSSSSPEPTASTHRTEAELRARLITAKDLGGAFSDDTFGRNIDATTLCGTPNPDGVVPPAIDAGSAAKTKTGISFQEEIAAFDDVETARRALDLDVGGFSCATGITADSSSTQSFAFQKPRDRSTDLGVENATEIDFQSSGFHGQIFIVRVDVTVLQFAFVALDTSDTSAVPDATSVVSRALERLAS
jgi:hypothetical protein